MPRNLKILHTSDWHLGRRLYGKNRYAEFEGFLDWLAELLGREAVDVLLVAGDIFDTTTPGPRSQALYYGFLRKAAALCRHVVIIAGNHDAPALINAPAAILAALDIHVVGAPGETPEDEVRVLRDSSGEPELIVCAVPFLRDRDVRVSVPGEQIADKQQHLVDGICRHYAEVAALARQKRETLGPDLPLVVMGHLFTAGGKTTDGDGVRELYVGSLARITADIFPEDLDYLALGHLHGAQRVAGSDIRRYSGSPLAMGFGEANQTKSVFLIEMTGGKTRVSPVDVPVFQTLRSIRGDWDAIESGIRALSSADSIVWLEITYDGAEVIGDLRERTEAVASGLPVEILRIKNTRMVEQVLSRSHVQETLGDLNPMDVFQRCLAAHKVPDDQQPELMLAYQEILATLEEAGDEPDNNPEP